MTPVATETSTKRETTDAEPVEADSAELPVIDGDARSPISDDVALGLNQGDRTVVLVLIVIACALMSVHWYRLTQSRPQPIGVLHPAGYRFQLDVNKATWVEWMQLDGLGEVLARRIVADRALRGPFASVDDVRRVKGIGPKTLETLRRHLICEPTRPLIDEDID